MKMTNPNLNEKRRPLTLKDLIPWFIAILVITSYVLLALCEDLRLEIPLLLGITAFMIILLAFIHFAGEPFRLNWSPALVMAVALIIRLAFLFCEPQLSDDIYRYLHDGLQSLTGHNPYALSPMSIRAEHRVLTQWIDKVNHPDLVTIYPPAAQIVFMAGSALGGTVLGMKMLLVALDLVTCGLILQLLRAIELPSWRAVLYAWHPLPVLEIAASGHIDGAAILFLFLALILLMLAYPGNLSKNTLTQRSYLCLGAGLAFALSCLVKLIPLAFLPACVIYFQLKRRCRMLFLLGAFAGGILLALPFLPEIQNGLTTLQTYLLQWEFAGLAYRAFRHAGLPSQTVRLLLAFGFALALVFIYANLLSKGNQAQNPAHAKDPILSAIKAMYSVSFAYLFFSPTLHPWYALYLAAFLPFAAGPAGLTLTWSVFLAYRVLIPYSILGLWIEDNMTPLTIWLAPITALALGVLARFLFPPQRCHL